MKKAYNVKVCKNNNNTNNFNNNNNNNNNNYLSSLLHIQTSYCQGLESAVGQHNLCLAEIPIIIIIIIIIIVIIIIILTWCETR